MRMLDLFSGIGGFALAAKWRWGEDLDLVGFCEIEKYAQKVLNKNFPGVPIYEDITKLNGNDFKDIDLITGGFPCQDISIAGKGEGIEGSRSGLWTELHRIIGEVRPRYALIENVPMLTIRGGTRVIADLAEIGYDAEWQIIGADDVGAWHRRKRIWVVAYLPHSESKRYGRWDSEECGTEGRELLTGKQGRSEMGSEIERCGKSFTEVPDTDRKRSQGLVRRPQEIQRSDQQIRLRSRARPRNWWNAEPDVGRVAHGIPNRVDRLKGLGNAIVPQVAYEIMKRL